MQQAISQGSCLNWQHRRIINPLVSGIVGQLSPRFNHDGLESGHSRALQFHQYVQDNLTVVVLKRCAGANIAIAERQAEDPDKERKFGRAPTGIRDLWN
jgi:hypothetical protein